MKAITIKQPFATLIAEGYKEYEFRSWKTAYRGEIYIHAGKSVDKEAMRKFAPLGLSCPTGCILAKAVLTDCVEVDDALRGTLRKKDFLVYSGTTEAKDWHGYGLHLEQVEKLEPIPARGMLGLWEYEPEAAATHCMGLNPGPFEAIRNGTKTIELRLYDEKRRKLRVGDTIVFTNTANEAETLAAEVLALFVFDSFDALYAALPLADCGYTEAELPAASPRDMEAYYSREMQQQYGVVGIRLRALTPEP